MGTAGRAPANTTPFLRNIQTTREVPLTELQLTRPTLGPILILRGLRDGSCRRDREGTVPTMTSRHTNPADDPRSDGDDLPEAGGISDDIALREAIARLMQDEVEDTPLSDDQRRARVEELREKIQGGDYMSEEKIGDIVDRLMKKWKL